MTLNALRIWIVGFLLCSSTAIFAQENWSSYFTESGVEGSITVFDYEQKKWYYSDEKDAHNATLPASTFKILHSLIALETKAITNENEVINWDGTIHEFGGQPMPAWNKDQNLKEAYKNSTVWFYVDLAKRIDRKTYAQVFQQIKYGNGDLSEKGLDFWNYGNFAITPINQINFLIKLYENDLPFSEQTIATVKEIMVSERNELGVFRDKTGWAVKDGQDIGWWIGYLTTENNKYFFATRIRKDHTVQHPDFAALRKSITKKVLEEVIAQ